MLRVPSTLVALASAAVVTGLLVAVPVSPAEALVPQLEGHVTGPSGQALPSVEVVLYDDEDGEWWDDDDTTTDPTGHYAFSGLPAGPYRVAFRDPTGTWATEYWNDEPDLEHADDVAVTATADLVRDAQLSPASHITGTVTDGTNGIGDLEVTTYQKLQEGPFSYWEPVDETSTEPDGTYDVSGLSAGAYRIGFQDYQQRFVGEYWDDRPDLASATDVVVGVDATVSGRDAVLTAGSHVTGRVTTSVGVGLQHVDVTAYQYDADEDYWDEVGWTETRPNGTYDLGGLAHGTYRIGFDPQSSAYAGEYYQDEPTVTTADDVTVGVTTTVALDDVQLAPSAHITGSVTGPTGAPLSDVDVPVFRYDTEDDFWDLVSEGVTGPTGHYDAGGLAAGTYRIGFFAGSDCDEDNDVCGSSDYAGEYWDDKPDVDTATDITVTAGGTASDRNAQLAAAASISGRVTDVNGAPASIDVYAFPADEPGSYPVGYGSTGADGSYRIGGLKAGSYKLEFIPDDEDSDWVPEFYDDAESFGTATSVTVGPGGHVTGKDAVVTRDDGLPLERNTVHPAVLGTPRVGSPLAVQAGAWNPMPGVVTYQWFANGVAIPGAMGATYTPTASDVGRSLSVRETASRTGWSPNSAFSVATGPVAAGPAVVTSVLAPRIDQLHPTVRKKLLVLTGTWSPAHVSLSYQWLANGKAIKRATRAFFWVTQAQLHERLAVVVTATAPGYLPTTVVTPVTAKVRKRTRHHHHHH